MTRVSYWFKVVLIAVAAAALGAPLIFAPSSLGQFPGRMEIPTQMSGKVLMEDGSPPPEPVQVEVVCGGGVPVPIARTDSKGGFVVRSAAETNIMDARQPGGGSMRGASQSAAPSVVPAGCSVQARLVGFKSSFITVVNAKAVDLGTIILRKTAGAAGSTVSVTSLKAPKNAQKAYEKAQKAIEKKKWDEARPELEKATQAYPEYAEAWFELGRVYQFSKDLAQAKNAYEQSIKADPKYIKPYLQMATIFNMEKKWKEMADVTATAIKLNPVDFPSAHVFHAMSALRLGDMKAADASAREAVKLDTEHAFPEAEYTLGLVLGIKGDFKGAVEHLRMYLQVAPESPSAEAVKRQLAEFEQLANTTPGAAPAAPK